MSMKSNENRKQKLKSDVQPRRARIRKNKESQLVLLSNSKGEHDLASITFGKYTVKGIAHKEALVNGKCLRVHLERINKKKVIEILKKQGDFKLKGPSTKLSKPGKAKREKPTISEKNQKLHKPLKLTPTVHKTPNKTAKTPDPSQVSVHGRVRTQNRRYSNFAIPGFPKTPKTTVPEVSQFLPKIQKTPVIRTSFFPRTRRTMSSDSEAFDKSDPLHIPSKDVEDTEEISKNSTDLDGTCDEVKSFLPALNEPLLTTIGDPPSDKEKDPLGIDTEIAENIFETPSKTVQTVESRGKFNGQNLPLRTYTNKRLRKSPALVEVEDNKRPKLDDTDTDDLEALLSGDIKPKVEDLDFPLPQPPPPPPLVPISEGSKNGHNVNSNPTSSLSSSTPLKVNSAIQNEVKTPSDKSASIVNGKISDSVYSYYLICRSGRPGRKKILKNNLGFEKLVHQLKLIKLPAPNWKIRIFVTRNQQISEITFTNKEQNERCVKFSRSSISYTITFSSKVVNLLGAPVSIDSHSDITFLLDVVHSLDENDPIIEYVSSTK